jgi:hypothetical protein
MSQSDLTDGIKNLPMGVVAIYFVDFLVEVSWFVEMLIGSYHIHQFLNCSFFIFIAASFFFLLGARSALPMGVAPKAMVGYL